MSKTHWKKLHNPDYLGAYSLPDGNDLIVTIKEVKREFIISVGGKKEECTVAHLEGQKPMILNVTNQKMITNIHGTPYIEDWKGKQIKLYCATTRLKGENVECLRIRPEVPVIELPEVHPQHKQWEAVKKAVQSGSYTIAQVRKKYLISNENAKLLQAKDEAKTV